MQIYVNLHIQTSLMQTELVRDWFKARFLLDRLLLKLNTIVLTVLISSINRMPNIGLVIYGLS